jgi:paraquat-inducible protein B
VSASGESGQEPQSASAAHRTHHSRIPLVWIVPALAALIGVWLAVNTFLAHGPTISVTFLDAEGLEAGKTRLRCQSVEIGLVKSITLSSDRRTVSVTIATSGFAAPFFVSSARFWVVRPRLGATGISGLGTLFSGAFVAMDIGGSKKPARHFTGLETPPVVASETPGREFILQSADVGSLSVSAPAYFRRIPVGRITSVDLDPDGRGVTFRVFVDAPYDQFVTTETRFWHASGIDVELNSEGLQVQSQSVTAIIAGGIAFETPPDSEASPRAAEDTHFALARNRLMAMMPPDGPGESYVLVFRESLRGLAPGAVVDFRGIPIGEVIGLNVAYDQHTSEFVFPVRITIYPNRFWSRYAPGEARPDAQAHALVARLIGHGFRAQLRSASLLTGQLYIALDFFPRARTVVAHPELTPMPLPTIPGDLDELQRSVASVAEKLDRLPLEKMARDADAALASLNTALGTTNTVLGRINTDVVPEAKSALAQARAGLQGALSPDARLQSDLHDTLSSVTRAADSIRDLVDYLDSHPESLLRGKPRDPEKGPPR